MRKTATSLLVLAALAGGAHATASLPTPQLEAVISNKTISVPLDGEAGPVQAEVTLLADHTGWVLQDPSPRTGDHKMIGAPIYRWSVGRGEDASTLVIDGPPAVTAMMMHTDEARVTYAVFGDGSGGHLWFRSAVDGHRWETVMVDLRPAAPRAIQEAKLYRRQNSASGWLSRLAPSVAAALP